MKRASLLLAFVPLVLVSLMVAGTPGPENQLN